MEESNLTYIRIDCFLAKLKGKVNSSDAMARQAIQVTGFNAALAVKVIPVP